MEPKGSDTRDRELVLMRTLNAPVDLVWKVWTNPEHIAKWWGPNGFTNTIRVMHVTVGGEWDFVMHGPDGTDYKNTSTFREVILHKKIVYEHITSPKFIATVTFEDKGEQTDITWSMLFETVEQFIQVVKTFNAEQGQKENMEKLSAYVQKIKTSRAI